jgi:hypothetical protein
LQVVEGELVGSPNDLGDGVDANDVPFQATFPYIGLPTSGSTSVNSLATSASTGSSASPGAATPSPQNSADRSSLVSPLEGGREDGGRKDVAAPASAAQTQAAATVSNDLLRVGLPVAVAGLLLFGGLWLVGRRRAAARPSVGTP